VGVPVEIRFSAVEVDTLTDDGGRIAVFLDGKGAMDAPTRKLDRKAKGAIARFAASDAFDRLKPGEGCTIAWPAGLAAEALLVVKLGKDASAVEARKAGATIAGFNRSVPLSVLARSVPHVPEIALGLCLRAYDFRRYRTPGPDWREPNRQASFMVRDPEAAAVDWQPRQAVLHGVVATRDLVNEPANVLTTVEFADRLLALRALGLEVGVLDEPELERLGMRTLLAVGRGSASPSKVVVLQWKGGGDEAPLALVGKGVVFDSGGISIKPASGMEEMTADMAGAGVVAGVMEAIARRGAKANVVGLVGLVENMLDGTAQRPGDVVRTMKGDTVEVINTDAEGRLVLADVLWYAQERFAPRAMIDLATLTGACVVALGHEMAAVFANDDALAADILAAAEAEDEGAWRMPLGPAYDGLIKSRIADVANVGGRPAGAITAAQFLQRFVREGTPWVHLDIAGVAFLPKASDLSAKGGSGWGVRLLDRLIRDRFEA
jgi:leucyl aminopeptidase